MEVLEAMPISPFPEDYRGSGLLLHLTSLPSLYGIGDFGQVAHQWIDLLGDSGQAWWQILPLGPTGFGNCPYQSLSTFAANPLLISPDSLVAEGLLTANDAGTLALPRGPIDFDAVTAAKRRLIEQVWSQFSLRAPVELSGAYEQFRYEQRDWLDDFALFECLKNRYESGSCGNWPKAVAGREREAIKMSRREFSAAIEQIRFGQFLAFRQISQLKDYAHSKGVRLIGDLPFFVSPESSDVWANPELFLLDDEYSPQFVAGVPPDYFSPDGQLWGNPVYNWEALRRTGYAWWLRRIRSLLQHVDVIRLDHFRAFAAAWHVPVTAETALSGEWRPGPGAEFFETIREELGGLPFLAEDLGDITDDVTSLRDDLQLTGMRVLQFAFDGRPDNSFLPHNFDHNTVAYTATHDNDTTRGWFESLEAPERDQVRDYLGSHSLMNQRATAELIRLIWHSKAAVTITPFQDLLNLGSEHRMNVPGRADGNWRWRCSDEMLSTSNFVWLRDLTIQSNRC